MKRLLPLLLSLAVLGAACQRSTTPTADKPAGTPIAGAAAPAVPPTNGQGAPVAVPGQPPPPPPAKPVPAVLPAVLAKVNGEEVQRWELDTAVKQAEASAGSAVPADRRDAVLRSILDELVTYHMLAQQAKGMKIQVSDADVDAEIAKIRMNFPTEEAFQQALASRSVTAPQLREQTRRTMEAQRVVDGEVTSKIDVKDAEVEAFYNQNIERFKQGDTVHASHIFISVPEGADAAAKAQARAKADAILKKVRAGGDFAAIAKAESSDTSAANGGDLGFFGKGDMPPDFEAAAFGMKPGTTSGVVELGSGFHIIKVFERRGPRTAPLAEVRDQVKAFLMQGQRQEKLEQFIQTTKGKTKIEILV